MKGSSLIWKKKTNHLKIIFHWRSRSLISLELKLMRIICDAVVTAVEYSFRFSLVSAADGWRLGTLVVHFWKGIDRHINAAGAEPSWIKKGQCPAWNQLASICLYRLRSSWSIIDCLDVLCAFGRLKGNEQLSFIVDGGRLAKSFRTASADCSRLKPTCAKLIWKVLNYFKCS